MFLLISQYLFVKFTKKRYFKFHCYKLIGLVFLINRQLDIFISEVLSIDYEVAKQKSATYPKLQVVGASTPFAESGYSYAFKKNSPWKPKFDLVMNRMKAENK